MLRQVILKTIGVMPGVMCVVLSIGLANAQVLQTLKGRWIIDYDATMQNMKNSPKYNPQEAERMPAIIQSLMKKMTIEVTDDSVIYHRGSKNQRMGYTIKSSVGDQVVLQMDIPEQDVYLSFSLLKNDRMNMKSSATDDMHYYIWKKNSSSN